MRASRKTVEKKAADANEPEKLTLTKQQAAQVLETQKTLQDAQQMATIVLSGVMAAAGIDKAEVVSGELGGDAPHLMIRRTNKEV